LDRSENYHVTLRFIGDVDDVMGRENCLDALLERVRREPFELRVEDLISFGGRKPRAIVATLGSAAWIAAWIDIWAGARPDGAAG